ncbi:putative uncharacterized protein [Pseudarthrobacter siccitolerans]|uniref:Uncharacterized protein n=1 Tax=Pseudarthrobacter siccitolerans TaxID=861266 RepID=A0A024H650_9MICC|nr:hypothetical protein [Pseudarthrobacter siccitolerans]CCQ47216.1 putative uncharacterized protein [Pseudarthrobacter siccitolerans]
MSNEYQLADGSPRYGHRTAPTTGEQTTPATIAPIEEAAGGAAKLSLDALAAAMDRRLRSAWADKPDPVVEALRDKNPEELAAARALVRIHLGSQREWRIKAQTVRDKALAGTMTRRRAAGRAQEIMALRFVLMAALIALPTFVVVTSPDDILKLLMVGAVCIAAAFACGYFLASRARVPVMPNIRGPWLNELREDVVNATLVAILQNKGTPVDPSTAAAARRGWESIQAASRAVDALHS